MNQEELVRYITQRVLEELEGKKEDTSTVPVGISARHIHLCKQDVEMLFGVGYVLKPMKALSQLGQFAAEETLEVIGPKGNLKKVRILGPERKETQVEVAASEARSLGMKVPVRCSGDIKGTPGVTLRGPKGEITLSCGVIIAERHLHLSTKESVSYGLLDGEKIGVMVEGDKGGLLGNVVVRVGDQYSLDLHIDTDDANAFGIMPGSRLKWEKI